MVYWVLGFLGLAAAGASIRWWLSLQLNNEIFPYGTLVANLTGCLLIGLLFGALHSFKLEGSEKLSFLLGVGFLGALTTFSSFAWEIFRWLQEGQWLMAGLAFFLHNGLGLAAVALGFFIALKSPL